MRQTVGILGTPIDILDTEAVLARLEHFIQQGRFHQVATANTDFLINALSDAELRHILRNADLVVPDGMPVVWAARMMRSHLPERVTGADIVPELAKLAARKGYRIFMLGAKPEVAQQAKARLETDYPGLQIVGCLSPKPSSVAEMDSETILDEIVRARPDILLVAFGNPKQEKWLHLHRERLHAVPVCIGVGGTFDFLAGETSRAPGWMQRNGMEWIFRLAQEPRRLGKRYIRDLVQFTRYMMKQWYGLRNVRGTGTSELYLAEVGDCTVLSIVGDFNADMLPRFQEAAEQSLDALRPIILDMQAVTLLDGAVLGTLLNLPKRAAFRNCDVRMVCVPPHIAKLLHHSQINDGLYTIAPTVAQSFTNGHLAGLCWHIQSGSQAAVVTVSGAAEPESLRRLESACIRLLRSGKRVDMDARSVHYADSALLAVLYRLTWLGRDEEFGSPGFRIAANETLQKVMCKDKMQDKFLRIDAPELPADARPYALVDETEEPETLESVAAYAPRA